MSKSTSPAFQSRETLKAELVLEELIYRSPLSEVLQRALAEGVCDREDLLSFGDAVFDGMVRLARGEGSAIKFKSNALPARGSFRR